MDAGLHGGRQGQGGARDRRVAFPDIIDVQFFFCCFMPIMVVNIKDVMFDIMTLKAKDLAC
jgi:hypothetical protein